MEFINQIKDNVTQSLSSIFSKEDVLAIIDKVKDAYNQENKDAGNQKNKNELINQICKRLEQDVWELVEIDTSIDFDVNNNTINAAVDLDDVRLNTELVENILAEIF